MKISAKKYILPFLPGVVILIYLILRVFITPISDDEYLTWREHVHRDIPTILTNGNPDIFWAPNNHILNTLLVKLSLGIFGEHDWAFRLHILLAFVVCYYFLYKIISGFTASSWRTAAYLGIIFLNPYLLDFFSIARGYALSMAGWAAAMYFLSNYHREPSLRNLGYTMFCLFLAIWANFSAFYFLPLFGLIFLYLLYQNRPDKILKKHLALLAGSSLVIAVVVLPPMLTALKAGTLVWGTGSFFQDSLVASVDYYQHFNHHLFRFRSFNKTWSKTEAITVILLLLWIALQLIVLLLPKRRETRAIYNMALFQGVGIVMIVLPLHWFFDVAYPHHRTALLFTFPFLLCLVFAMETLTLRYRQVQVFTGLAISFCAWHCFISWNVENTMEWYQNGDAKRVFTYLEEDISNDRKKEIYTLGAEQWQYFTMGYYADTNYKDLIKLEFSNMDADNGYDYFYAPKNLKNKVWPAYQEVKEFKHGSLFKRIPTTATDNSSK